MRMAKGNNWVRGKVGSLKSSHNDVMLQAVAMKRIELWSFECCQGKAGDHSSCRIPAISTNQGNDQPIAFESDYVLLVRQLKNRVKGRNGRHQYFHQMKVHL